MKVFWLMAMLLLLSPVSAAPAEEKINLGEVVVTAARVAEPVEETTSDVTVIKGDDIKKMNVEFAPDVLRRLPELNLTQNGGPGTQATVFLRGGTPSQTLVMIDGVRVNNALVGQFDFAGISVDDIDRIEIVKGPQSTMYGSEAMAGVINIITKKGEGGPRAGVSVEGGSFGTARSSLNFSGGQKTWDYRVTGDYFSTDGISAAKSGSEKDGYKNASLSGKLGIKPTDNFELEIVGRYYNDRTDLDDFDFFARQAVDNLNFVQHGLHYLLSAKGKLYLSKVWEQVLTASTVMDSLKFRDPLVSFNNADAKATMNTIDWQNNFYLTDFYTLTAGAEYRRDKGENPGNFDESIDNKALYLNNILKLFKEDLVLNAGLRHDKHETFGDKTTYKVGAVYHIRPIELSIKSSYGTGFRAPAFNELFFPFYGNLNLKPEESAAWEIGVEKIIVKNRLSVSLTYFDQRYKNLIETDPLTFTAANISQAKVKGVEVETSLKLTDNIDIKAGYMHLDTENETTGQILPLRPRDKFNLSAAYATQDVSVMADYIYVSKRFDPSSLRDLSPYSLVKVSADYKALKWLTLFGRIDNLFNAHYEEVGSFGAPGFSVFVGVRITTL